MPQHLPKIPGGTDPRSIWERSVEERLREMRIMDVAGMVVNRTRRGTAIIAKPGKGGGGITISAYRFKRIGDAEAIDYIVCKSWDGTTEGETEINIALPFKMRASVTTEIIDGVTYNYSEWDTDAQTRVSTNAADATDTETQVITPRYIVDDLILAAPAFTGVLAAQPEGDTDHHNLPVTLQDLNVDARAYSRVSDSV